MGNFAAIVLSTPLLLFGATTIKGNVCDTMVQPVITHPKQNARMYAGTLNVSGTATGGATVRLRVDGATKTTVTATSAGNFSGTVSLIAKGSHSITAVTSNACSDSISTPVNVIVIKKQIPPDPTNPPDQNSTDDNSNSTDRPAQPSPQYLPATYTPNYQPSSTPRATSASKKFSMSLDDNVTDGIIDGESIYVSGTLSKRGTVVILLNGKVVARMDQAATSFAFTIPLQLGENEITIKAAHGNETLEEEVIITREDSGASGSGQDVTGSREDGSDTSKGSEWVGYAAVGAAVLGILGTVGGLFFLATKRRKKDEEENQPWQS